MKTALMILAMLAGQADPLQQEIDAIKEARAPWRGIAWKECLVDGLRESARTRKPVLLWVFIDRPIDDKRC